MTDEQIEEWLARWRKTLLRARIESADVFVINQTISQIAARRTEERAKHKPSQETLDTLATAHGAAPDGYVLGPNGWTET